MSLLITRGFGEDIVIEYVSVPVCEPKVITHEYGERNMVGKELKPIMIVEKPPRVCKEEGEE